ncbi:hypothetical protein [Cupriavidus taiwanensis]|uniref:Uncharacterized protein n=1 Tax=Cupriavidus taiwanensis TaxID=164546 RepID=A0A375GMF5_9BURK|nr:hypothetical protein [Cupriavidus taiwanensis]SOY64493.1 hypothetical protein CBM2585_B20002 [Cupriavidus taiwanensis]SOZ08559.1 protein of unknown function [Cupriavidus taiwanensis]SOZ10896.1 protein of unknown function [Cupriavidus taiwanensis]SOZ42148.1 protein of unknown function [Cupriavidus taiwanensis]SPC20546.1 hypothetical protein CT19431_MP80396 [Cupriavidus taiwanensis]
MSAQAQPGSACGGGQSRCVIKPGCAALWILPGAAAGPATAPAPSGVAGALRGTVLPLAAAGDGGTAESVSGFPVGRMDASFYRPRPAPMV